jgi:hypothetical protein
MMSRTKTLPITLAALLLATACNHHGGPEPEGPRDTAAQVGTESEEGAPITFPQVDDNVRHDTLLIQTTFDMGDGTFLMVASHHEETFTGLRLYHYRRGADSSAQLIHVSSPAFDSWTMYPTFFRDPQHREGYIILANFGERDSWGQKVLRFRKSGFEDLGFLDVALVVKASGGNSARLDNVGPSTRVTGSGSALLFRFEAEEVHLYDDLRGNLDVDLPGNELDYRWDPSTGMELRVNGQVRDALTSQR